MMKTLNGWLESTAEYLSEYMLPGDKVEDKLIEVFLGCIPRKRNVDVLQSRYPIQFQPYVSLFLTFTKKNGQWYYCGYCPEGLNQSCSIK